MMVLIFQNTVSEGISRNEKSANFPNWESRFILLEQTLLHNEQTMQQTILSQENKIQKMQKEIEELQRTAKSLEKLNKEHEYAIEYVNASVGSKDKYGCSESNESVVFAANIHLGAAYFLPVGRTISSYNQILINVGNSFDGYMGTFVAPNSGVYEFWMDAKILHAKHAMINLRVNEEVVKEFSSGIYNQGAATAYFGLHGNAVLSLSAYDIVDLFVVDSTDATRMNAICGHETHYFMFAGRSL